MTWEYLIGSEKDFEGAPDWCTHASKYFWTMNSVVKLGDKFQARGGVEVYHYDESFSSGEKIEVVAQRRKIESMQWDGVGLPTVGCECEALIPYLDKSPWRWRKVKVICHGDEFNASGELIVVDVENTRPCWADEFRPLRSEHEIKVDGFKLDLLNVISMIGNQFGGIGITSDGIEAISHELIMLGYEKTK